MINLAEGLCYRLKLEKLDKITLLNNLTSRFGIKPSSIALAIISFLTFNILMENGIRWLASAVGFLYPAYLTAKVARAKSDENEEEGKFWIKYWLVYGLVYITEIFFMRFLSMIPYYYIIKIVFFLWLYYPETQGAVIVYEKTVKAFFSAYEPKIDEKLAPIQRFDSTEFLKNTIKNITINTMQAIRA